LNGPASKRGRVALRNAAPRLLALEAECEHLRQALAPFARVLDLMHVSPHVYDDTYIMSSETWNSTRMFTVGDLRRAAALTKGEANHG